MSQVVRAAQEISLDEARRVAVVASGITSEFSDVATALGYLAAVQLDAINAVARAHELTLAIRSAGQTTRTIDDALWNTDEPVAFEYWAHAASLIPVGDWPLWAFRRRRTRTADIDWRPDSSTRARIIAAVADHGPSTMRQIRGDEQSGKGWDWSPTKTAVEYLIWSGELVCVRRQGWQRVFDLPQRCLPAHLLDQEADDDAGVVRLLTKSARVLGVATADDLADYLRIKKHHVLAHIEDTALERIRVAGWRQPAWAHPDALAALDGPVPPAEAAARFVGPFDNLIWYRARLKRLFGFDHVLEAYKPAAARRFGYYVLPLLVGDRFVGRADLSIEADRLRVLSLSTDPGHDVPAEAMQAAFEACMRTTGTTELVGGPNTGSGW